MKTPVTIRLDPDLLEEVRDFAERENRSLTNFIETALKDRINCSALKDMANRAAASEKGIR